MNAVLDCGVIFSGAGWRTEAYRCLVALAHRGFTAFGTTIPLDESLATEQRRKGQWPNPEKAQNIVDWCCDRVQVVLPPPLGKQRSRDAKEDPYLACALSVPQPVSGDAALDVLMDNSPKGTDAKEANSRRRGTPHSGLKADEGLVCLAAACGMARSRSTPGTQKPSDTMDAPTTCNDERPLS